MLFGERLQEVRKKKKLSQDELAKKINAQSPVIGRYERGEVKPSIEVAVKLANALDVSLDYLVGNTDMKLDADVLKRIVEIQKLPEADLQHFFFVIDGLLRDAKAREAYIS